MADIFISYAKEDRSRIITLVTSLKELGWTVWWDRTIPAGKTWRQVIGKALDEARSVIVAWSETSIDSRWVQEEADSGAERDILIPIIIDDVKLPLGFRSIQAVNLINWKPSALPSQQFKKLISDLESVLGSAPNVPKIVKAPSATKTESTKTRVEVSEEEKIKEIVEGLKELMSLKETVPGKSTSLWVNHIWISYDPSLGFDAAMFGQKPGKLPIGDIQYPELDDKVMQSLSNAGWEVKEHKSFERVKRYSDPDWLLRRKWSQDGDLVLIAKDIIDANAISGFEPSEIIVRF